MPKLALLGGTAEIAEPFPTWPFFNEEEIKAVVDVVSSGKWWRYEGSKVKEFEAEFSKLHEALHATAVMNGTAALELAVAAAGIGQGDEVIVPSYTFIATATSVVINGASVAFADIEDDTYCIDPCSIEEAISENTKAIMPVHFGGYPADMDRIMGIAEKYGLIVIEDAAHAHGGKYKGKMLGSIGDMSCFSFQSSKNIAAGEGGMVLTNNRELHEAVFSRHTFGRKPGRPWYEHHVISTNARMTELQAALLLVQLSRLKEQTKQRLANARLLDEAVEGTGILAPLKRNGNRDEERAYHIYIMKYKPGIEGVSRDIFIEALNAEGVPVGGGYPMPLYRQKAFEGIKPPSRQKCRYGEIFQDVCERAVSEAVWIPHHLLLGDGKMVRDIIRCICKVIENADELRQYGK